MKQRVGAVAGMVPYNVAALGHGRFHKGVERDPGQAAAWLRKAQAVGDPEAEAALEELLSARK